MRDFSKLFHLKFSKNNIVQKNLDELYLTEPVQYKCNERSISVNLIALWFLDTDIGCDSLLAKSSKVICSNATDCTSLKRGTCPLTIGYGEALNKIQVLVMHNETPLEVNFKGQKLIAHSSSSLSTGQYVWFGKTQVFRTTSEAGI